MTGTRAHRFCTLLLGMLVVVGAFGCRSTVDGIATPPTDPDAYPNGDLLVSAEWLHAHASDPEIRLVDLSPLHTYKRGHLPGAVHLWWQDTIEVHNDVYGMLAGAPALEAMIRSAGITPDSTVILYDDAGNRYAARFLWALNAVGFDQVRLLNGGRQAWEAAGFAMTRDRPSPEPGALDIALSYDVLIGADDVQARLNDPSVVIVDNRTPEERAETWFRNAFKGGGLTYARAELRGDLHDFPFDAGNGLFLVEFDVDDVSLQYSDKWPIVDGVRAHGAIAGRRFRVQAQEARFFTSPGRDIDLAIPDLFSKTPVLQGVATVRATLPDVLRTIAESPLKDGPAARLSTLDVQGDFDLALDLDIGLKRGAERTVLGTVDFDGNRLRTQDGKLTLQDLRGRVNFTRTAFHGENLAAQYEGGAVALALDGGVGDTGTEFRMTGRADAAGVRDYLQRYVPYLPGWLARADRLDAITGDSAWRVVLNLPPATAGAPPAARRLRVESSLDGLGIALPWPFGKVAAETKPLAIETTIGSDAARTTRVAFGEAVRVELDQAARDGGPGSGRVTRADVAFGRSEAAGREPGIWLHGELSSLPLADWARLLQDASTPQSPTAGLPLAFDVRVKELATLGQRFTDVRFRGRKEANAWRIAMESARAAGDITVPFDIAAAPLTLNLQRLWLEKVDAGGQRTEIDPRRMPGVALACASFRYGTIDFGSASLSTARQADGQKLEKLVFTNAALQAAVTGEWLLREGRHRSHFSIDLTARALGDMLATFGYDTANHDEGKTRLEIEAEWQGMPSEFTLDRLDGSLGLRVGKGRFLDMDPGGGRLFGLLSLQTLPRRLALDFSDLFQKGFAFDRIEGWFELEKGNAYTNSLLMEGPSAKVEISGRTGLAAKDYDQIAIVTPALSESLPLASAVFGPAGIGVGAAIYLGQKGFKEVPAQVDRFLRREYAVTGPWADPKVEKR